MNDENRLNLGHLALVFFGFAVLYFATAFFFGQKTYSSSKTVAANQLYGPIKTKQENTVVVIKITNRAVREGWHYMEAELLDFNQDKVLMTFAGEAWHETGRDYDGPWSESERETDLRITIPQAGAYFLSFSIEGGPKHSRTAKDLTDKIRLSITEHHLKGSTTVFNRLGILLFVIAVVLNEIQNLSIIKLIIRIADA